MPKDELRRLKAIAKEKSKGKLKANNATKANAIAEVERIPELAHGEFAAGAEVDATTAPHVTHDIRHMPNDAVIFCNNCGKWARRNQHSKLAATCGELKKGTRHNLRLLQNGIIPVPGAKLAANVKERAGRKNQ